MNRHHDLVASSESLSAVMVAESDIYRALLSVAGRQQEAIIAGDVAVLTQLVEEQQQLAEHLNALETERMTAMVAIEAATGLDAEHATLSEVAAAMPADAAAELTRLGHDVRAQALALRETHAVNERLLRSSRSLIDRWIRYMRSLLVGTTYQADGDTGSVPGGRALDKSA